MPRRARAAEQSEITEAAAEAFATRPMPPPDMIEMAGPSFAPAYELAEWVDKCFLQPGSLLFNEDHVHLQDARIGYLWSALEYTKQGRLVVGTCEMFQVQGSKWIKARAEQQMIGWFGSIPDFIITLFAPWCAAAEDATFCATTEHELYHASFAVDKFGAPRFDADDQYIFRLRGHDVEEHLGVVERYGPGAASSNVSRMVELGRRSPLIAAADIRACCGNCL